MNPGYLVERPTVRSMRFANLYRRFRRPYRVRWSDLGPPRLDSPDNTVGFTLQRYGSLVDRITRLFLSMDQETMDKVLAAYRVKYGDGAYAYAKRTIAHWKPGQIRHVGQTVMRLLEVVPLYVDLDAKFELARIVREETLRRIRRVRMTIPLSPDSSLSDAMAQVQDVVQAQLDIELPPGVLEGQTWLTREDATLFQQIIREGERVILAGQIGDLFLRIRLLQDFRRRIDVPAKIHIVFELPTAEITFNIVKAASASMSHEEIHSDDSGFLAKWSELELETRFRSGDVSYPEYVLRNMDQFFSKEEQAELHKIAAMHGLELERLLMEIQIKSRTSEADLDKLLKTLKTLQEKGINAEVVSRHETPSGHIEISARSRRKFGCAHLPGMVLLGSWAVWFLAHR